MRFVFCLLRRSPGFLLQQESLLSTHAKVSLALSPRPRLHCNTHAATLVRAITSAIASNITVPIPTLALNQELHMLEDQKTASAAMRG